MKRLLPSSGPSEARVVELLGVSYLGDLRNLNSVGVTLDARLDLNKISRPRRIDRTPISTRTTPWGFYCRINTILAGSSCRRLALRGS